MRRFCSKLAHNEDFYLSSDKITDSHKQDVYKMKDISIYPQRFHKPASLLCDGVGRVLHAPGRGEGIVGVIPLNGFTAGRCRAPEDTKVFVMSYVTADDFG